VTERHGCNRGGVASDLQAARSSSAARQDECLPKRCLT
jgi:hypothetical protein